MRPLNLLYVLMAIFPGIALSQPFQSDIIAAEVQDGKQTPQEKYLNSKEAYDLLRNDPSILFIDVRDPLEVKIAGHPRPVDAVVPYRMQSTEFDEQTKEWVLKENPDFLMYMEQALQDFDKSRDDMIIVTCGSGRRSAEAARMLHTAGYSNVWHIPDGYPGDEKPGFNTANAWQLEGLPWSYGAVYGSDRLRVIE